MDLYYKQFNRFLDVPIFLNKKLTNIYNEIQEESIDLFFKNEESVLKFDIMKLEFVKFYKEIVFDIKVGSNDIDRLKNLQNVMQASNHIKIITFIKNSKLDILEEKIEDENMCNLKFPKSIYDLKEIFLNSFQNKKLKDFNDLKKLSEMLATIFLNFDIEFNIKFFEMLSQLNEDPLKVYKEYVIYKFRNEERIIIKDLYDNIKSLYKYGRGEISDKLCKLKVLKSQYDEDINIINIKLKRNFLDFKTLFCDLDLCNYFMNEKLRQKLEIFDDLLNYSLIYFLKNYINNVRCNGKCKFENNKILEEVDISYQKYIFQLSNITYTKKEAEYIQYNTLVANLIKSYENKLASEIIKNLSDLEYTNIHNNLSKFIYCINENKTMNYTPLMFETCIYKNIKFKKKEYFDSNIQIPEVYLNQCLNEIFNIKEVGYILENRNKSMQISGDVIKNIGSLTEMSLCSKPEDLFVELKKLLDDDRSLKNLNSATLMENLENDISKFILEKKIINDNYIQAYKTLEKYFKNLEALKWQTNYKYYLFLLIHKSDVNLGERYFLDCQVYEFFDRMKLAQEYIYNKNNNLIYNIILQYKAFEIEDKINKKIKNAKDKIRKEPKLYIKIREELCDYLTLPVTKILSLNFDKPSCQCNLDYNKEYINDKLIIKLIDNPIENKNEINTKCICEKLTNLAENFNRSKIKQKLEFKKALKKNEIVELFYNRKVEDKFSFNEICLSKAMNKITEDDTHLLLLEIGLTIKLPPFLYFIFKYADDEVTEEEEGTGIKGGTGEKNISDKIEDEDEISNENCEEDQKVEEDDGVDIDNEGSMSSIENEKSEEYEEGVDRDKSDENEEEERDRMEELDKIREEEENEGLGEENKDEGNDGDFESEGSCDIMDKEENNIIDGENKEEDKANIINDYNYKEGKLNANQMCNEAIDYERRVFGECDEQALCPGEGDHEVEGDVDKGKKEVIESVINYKYTESYSEKLVLMLKNILESNKCNKYKGDYKSGKKLNMKKIIPYIASDYKRDKIWMKRRNNDKKDYILRIFIDNSRNMYSHQMIETLMVLYSRIKNGFKALGIPTQIYKFGNECVTCEIEDMKFSDSETNIDLIDDFTDGINIVLTDGIFQRTGFYNPNFLVILIDKHDILKMSKVTLTDDNIFIQKYLDIFSLKYCIIRDVDELESTFILALSELLKTI